MQPSKTGNRTGNGWKATSRSKSRGGVGKCSLWVALAGLIRQQGPWPTGNISAVPRWLLMDRSSSVIPTLYYHRVLNHAVWSSLAVSAVLLTLLVNTFARQGPVVVGLDKTVERRRGKKIKAKGIYRDPVRSSKSHFVKASGLRWISMMLLVHIPWVQRVWGLPFLTVLAPSERYYEDSPADTKN
jgi:hypothetical protein